MATPLPRRAAGWAVALFVTLGALALGPPPAHAAQSLAPREVQRLLAEASSSLSSARALLASDEPQSAKTRLSEAEIAYRAILDGSPRHREATLGLASVLFLTRRYDEGLRLVEPLHAEAPHDLDLTHQLGLHLYRAGQVARALPLLEQAAAEPSRFDAAWLLAVHFYRDASWSRGLPHAERYVAARPEDLRALGVLGTYYLKLDRLPEAVASFDRYLAAFPDQLSARINRANALFRQGDLDRAAQEYVALVAAHPDRSRLVYNLASVRIQQGRCEDALPLLSRFIAKEREDGPARYFRADCLLRLERLDEARAAFEEALAVAAHNPWIHHGLSRIDRAQGRLPAALDHARRAAELAPDDADLLAWHGTLLRLTGAPSEALALHDEALRHAPDRAPLHVERGRDAWALLDLAVAGDAFGRALELEPRLASALTGRAAVRTALAGRAFAAGELDAAERLLTDALADAPADGAARTNLALVLLARDRAAPAAALLDEAPPGARDGDHAAALALARSRLGDSAGALAALQQSEGLTTTLSPVRHEAQANIAAQHGEWEAAARSLDAACAEGCRDAVARARVQAWLEAGLDRLARADAPAARAALAQVGPHRAALSPDDRAVLDLATAALAVLAGDGGERATEALLALIRAPAYRGPRFAAARDQATLIAAFGRLRAGDGARALELLGAMRGPLSPAGDALARQARDQEARAAHAARDFSTALRHWQSELERTPEDAVAQLNLGAALFATGRTSEATASWRSLAERGGPPEAHYNLGVAADRATAPREAWRHFLRYLALAPAADDALRERVRAKERVFGFRADGGPP